ncbi:MAG: M48 family metallopeptidase [Gammaproteobacteria bacterium]|nr:M48 family metallopeptidase [Gammaproteobacteria bacterium]MCY4211617.1 M48 family metallopeptidase [Gammaproteobacteria bacterium]MCY4282416.1 M48 family metallopeptidase [Gammaproteobacteria bacterium]
MNTFTYALIIALIAGFLLQWRLSVRHIRHITAHRDAVPDNFADKIPLAAHRKAADYTCAKTRLRLVELVVSSLILLLLTLGGGLDWIDAVVRAYPLSGLWTGTVFILAALLITSLLDLPLSLYRTFGLEQHFGFNKMTLALFVSDLLKNTLLMLAIGTPLILLVLWFMDNAGAWWWLYVWLVWLGFNLVMVWAYPAFIAPLFNKFRPLQNTDLAARIGALLDRNGFTSNGIFVMDGSTRSTHGNAYFTGLGANKRIVFFDTLVDELSYDEIEAVLAHELGHFKCGHVKKRLSILGATFLVGFAVLGILLEQPWFYSGLGVSERSDYMALTLFVLVAPAFTCFLQPLFSAVSRKHEFEADDFAKEQVQAGSLINALVKLYRENANTLTPDPMYSAFHDSHPPAPIRVAHLGG